MKHCQLFGFRLGNGKHSHLFIHLNSHLGYYNLWQKPYIKPLSLDLVHFFWTRHYKVHRGSFKKVDGSSVSWCNRYTLYDYI